MSDDSHGQHEAEATLPSPAVVVLVGPSSSGKSTWAEANFKPGQVLSSDAFRAFHGAGPDDQTAGTEAFALLDQLLAARTAKGLTTVIDTLGLDADKRAAYLEVAGNTGMTSVAVGFDTAAAVCHERNQARAFPLPKSALDRQLKQWRATGETLHDEGFDRVIVNPGQAKLVPVSMTSADRPPQADKSDGAVVEAPSGSMAFDLVISSFDFGPSQTVDMASTLVTMARAAEAAGFRALWLMDHFRQIPQVGRKWEPMLEPYTTLAYLANATETLRMGTLVTNAEHRNVGLLAKIVATLDVLSGGRAECGLGAGWFGDEQAAFGYPVNSNQVRLDTLEEAVQALRILWGPGAKTFEGTFVNIAEALAYPRPIQDPLPILVGGGGEKRTLRIAARYADACNFVGSDPEMVEHKIEVVRSHCHEAQRNPDDVVITTLNPIIHADSGSALSALLESLRPANRSAESFAAANQAATTDEHVDRFAQLAGLGVKRVCVALTGNTGPERIEDFAAVIEQLNPPNRPHGLVAVNRSTMDR